MSLPQVDHLIASTVLPSSGKKVRFRPYLFKEEKILLTAKESGSADDMATAIKQVISNVMLDEIDIDRLPAFDIEHLMVRIREASVGEAIPLKLPVKKCSNEKCPCELSAKVDLRGIKLDKPVPDRPKVTLNSTAFLTLRYPTFAAIRELAKIQDTKRRGSEMVARCIDQIVDGDSVTYADDYDIQQLVDWIDTFSSVQFDTIKKFIESLPQINESIEFKCPVKGCEVSEKLTLQGFESFFF